MMKPLDFGNVWIISSHTLLGMQLLIHTGIKVNHFRKKEPQEAIPLLPLVTVSFWLVLDTDSLSLFDLKISFYIEALHSCCRIMMIFPIFMVFSVNHRQLIHQFTITSQLNTLIQDGGTITRLFLNLLFPEVNIWMLAYPRKYTTM